MEDDVLDWLGRLDNKIFLSKFSVIELVPMEHYYEEAELRIFACQLEMELGVPVIVNSPKET